jgi:hypothetical protein
LVAEDVVAEQDIVGDPRPEGYLRPIDLRLDPTVAVSPQGVAETQPIPCLCGPMFPGTVLASTPPQRRLPPEFIPARGEPETTKEHRQHLGLFPRHKLPVTPSEKELRAGGEFIAVPPQEVQIDLGFHGPRIGRAVVEDDLQIFTGSRGKVGKEALEEGPRDSMLLSQSKGLLNGITQSGIGAIFASGIRRVDDLNLTSWATNCLSGTLSDLGVEGHLLETIVLKRV